MQLCSTRGAAGWARATFGGSAKLGSDKDTFPLTHAGTGLWLGINQFGSIQCHGSLVCV